MLVNPLRTVSPFTVALWVSWMKAPLAFKARCFWVRLSGSGLKSWGTKSRVQAFCYSRGSSRLWVFSWLWLARPGLGLWWDCVSASPIHFTFLICPMCRIHSARVFFPPRGNRSVCSYRFVCPWEDVSSGSFYTAVLNHNPNLINVKDGFTSTCWLWFFMSQFSLPPSLFLLYFFILYHEDIFFYNFFFYSGRLVTRICQGPPATLMKIFSSVTLYFL